MGTIRFGIPKYLDKKRKSGKLYDSGRSVWSGNVINLIMKISPLMAFIMVAISSTIGPVLNSIDVSYSTIFITNIQLFSLLALLSFAIIFKMLIEINNRKIIYRNLKFIGYSDEKLKSIIKKEMFIFYSIFLVLTFIPLIIMGASSIIRNCLLIKELIQIIIAPLITIIILGVISYKLYKDRVFRMIKGWLEMEKVIEVQNLTKIYGTAISKTIALDNINLEVYKGEFVGIMGPSGSGKTTLLNIVSTIDNPSKGLVELNGIEVCSMYDTQLSKFRYENIGFIFQEFNLIDNITVGENIAIPLTLSKKLGTKEIREKTVEYAKRLGIEEVVDKYPNECSGGQRQRAAIARALVNNPSIIVADEPTGNLDSKNSHELLKILKELNSKEGKTIVMVTHDSMIASYCERILLIKDGKIEEYLEREDLSQKEFFYKIVDMTSKESQSFLSEME